VANALRTNVSPIGIRLNAVLLKTYVMQVRPQNKSAPPPLVSLQSPGAEVVDSRQYA
jgi:hypothetical protein